MSDETFVTIINHLIDFMRQNLEDPRARDGEWIYPDYPRTDALMPRISVTYGGLAGRSEKGLGDEGQRLGIYIDVDVWTDTKFDWVNNGETYSGGKLREYLASEINDLFLDARPTLMSAYNWKDFKLEGMPPAYPYDEELDQHRKTLRYLLEIEQPSI